MSDSSIAADPNENTSTLCWYFHCRAARKIIAADQAGETTVRLSLDLNISKQNWGLEDHHILLDTSDAKEFRLKVSALEPVVASENKIFSFDGQTLAPIEVRADGYYKLVPTDSVPTLEINGIKMHRSKDIDPLEDARLKTELVVRNNDIVLDTCAGLGYSALFALKAGAKQVVSTEKSPWVLKVRAQNPWTRPDGFDWLTPERYLRLHLEHADIFERIQRFEDETFNSVIHDPPRFCSATGDLYGKVFYEHLARVLRPSGRIFHYTGSPKRIKNGNRFVNNAMKRMEQAGFTRVQFNDHLQGIVAEKSRPLF